MSIKNSVCALKALLGWLKRAAMERLVKGLLVFIKKQLLKKLKMYKGYVIYDSTAMLYMTYPLCAARCGVVDTTTVSIKSYRAILDRVAGKLEHCKHFKEALVVSGNIFLIEGWCDANPMIIIEDEATERLRVGGLRL